MLSFYTIYIIGVIAMFFIAIIVLVVVMRRQRPMFFEKDIHLAAQEQWEADRHNARVTDQENF